MAEIQLILDGATGDVMTVVRSEVIVGVREKDGLSDIVLKLEGEAFLMSQDSAEALASLIELVLAELRGNTN